jgi:hypothetical protein
MQILAIAASVCGFILTMGQFEIGVLHGCWFGEHSNRKTTEQSICEKMDASSTVSHVSSFTFNAVEKIGNFVQHKLEVGQEC